MTSVLATIENACGSLAMLAMVVLPLAEIVFRRVFGQGLPGSGPIVQHLTLWVGFIGSAMAARDGKLLALATGTFIPAAPWRRAADILAAAFGAGSAVVLAWGAYQMVAIERESGTTIGADIQAWVAQLVLPISFALIAVRLVWRPGFNALNPAAAIVADATMTEPGDRSRWSDRALASLGIAAGPLLLRFPSIIEGQSLRREGAVSFVPSRSRRLVIVFEMKGR